MINVLIPENLKRRLPFYLAAEEWVAQNLPPEEYFFAWRVEPTVICGRNQTIANEVDLDFCRSHGIDVVRRKSGGGCVYADLNNYMFSYITPSTDVSPTFSRYTSMIVGLLESIGIKAHANGRNDIFVGESKIAGNAFYRKTGRAIVHGTLLVDIDYFAISHAITPSRAKLNAHGVASTASRVTSLRALGKNIETSAFGKYATEFLCGNDNFPLTRAHLSEIEEIEQCYYLPEFLADRHLDVRPASEAEIIRKTRFDGVGEFEAAIKIDSEGKIKKIKIAGDFFALDDFRTMLLDPLVGIPYSKEEIAAKTAVLPVSGVICNLSAEQLTQLLI